MSNSCPATGNSFCAWNAGEDWSETIDGFSGRWVVRNDQSCWGAVASNMIRYISGRDYYHQWMYVDGVPTTLSDNGTSFWHEGGDIIGAALDYQGYLYHSLWADDMLASAWLYTSYDPMEWIETRVERGKPIGASFKGDGFAGHTFTIYGIDRSSSRLLIADSDSDYDDKDLHWRSYWRERYSDFSEMIKIDFSGDGRGREMNTFTSFSTRRWIGSGVGGDDWINDWHMAFPLIGPWSGDSDSAVCEIIMDRPGVCRVTQTGATSTRLVLYGDPSHLEVTNTGALSVRTFMMRKTPELDVNGFFLTESQACVDGTVTLGQGGEWWTGCEGYNFIGAGTTGTLNQRAGYLDNWNLVLGHEASTGTGY